MEFGRWRVPGAWGSRAVPRWGLSAAECRRSTCLPAEALRGGVRWGVGRAGWRARGQLAPGWDRTGPQSGGRWCVRPGLEGQAPGATHRFGRPSLRSLGRPHSIFPPAATAHQATGGSYSQSGLSSAPAPGPAFCRLLLSTSVRVACSPATCTFLLQRQKNLPDLKIVFAPSHFHGIIYVFTALSEARNCYLLLDVCLSLAVKFRRAKVRPAWVVAWFCVANRG